MLGQPLRSHQASQVSRHFADAAFYCRARSQRLHNLSEAESAAHQDHVPTSAAIWLSTNIPEPCYMGYICALAVYHQSLAPFGRVSIQTIVDASVVSS